jgi:endoglucanase
MCRAAGHGHAAPSKEISMLRQDGPNIVDDSGATVLLRGVGLGGWMNMENFITGFPGNEESWRAALRIYALL